MHDHDGTVRRGAVKIKPGDPHIFHIDRIQPPADHRGVAGLCRDGLAQAIKNGLDGFQPRPDLAIGIGLIEPAQIGAVPDGTGAGMGMPLDKAGHQHLVGKTFVQPVFAPARQFVQRANAQNMAVADRDMAGRRALRIHGDDLAG